VTAPSRSVSSPPLVSPTPTPRSTPLLVVLGVLSTFGPLTTDLYLPGLPEVADELGASESQVQLTLTACLIGLALGQAIAGPVSDTLGRRRPLLVGLALFVVASLGCAVAPSILVLDVLRLVQGLCGAAGIVLARAIVRDRWSGLEAARIYAALMTALSLGPILAPTIGGGLLHITDWRGLFVVLAGWGVALLVAAAVWVPETLPPSARRPAGLGRTLRVMRRLLRDRVFTGYTVGAGLSFGALFSYIAGSSFVFQDVYDVSPQVYALLFGLNGVALLGASIANHRLQESVGPVKLLRAGMVTMLVGGALVVLAVVTDAGLTALVAALFVAVAGIGFVPSNGVALALEHHGADAGTASALIGVVQFTIGGLAAPLPGVAGATALPMALGVIGFAVAALVTVRVVVGSDRVEHAREAA